jgi:hypothetical protein
MVMKNILIYRLRNFINLQLCGERAVYRGNEFEYITKDDKIYKLFVRELSSAPDDFELNGNGAIT